MKTIHPAISYIQALRRRRKNIGSKPAIAKPAAAGSGVTVPVGATVEMVLSLRISRFATALADSVMTILESMVNESPGESTKVFFDVWSPTENGELLVE